VFLVVLIEGFWKVPIYVDQSLPVSRKSRPKFKFLPLISAPPKGFWGKFCPHTIGGLSPCLSSKTGKPSPIPQFLGNFYRNFGVSTWPTPGQRHRWQNHGTTSQQAKRSPALGNYPRCEIFGARHYPPRFWSRKVCPEKIAPIKNTVTYRVSQKNIPDIFVCNLKKKYSILIIFGVNISGTVCHQMDIQFTTSFNVCFCTTWGKLTKQNMC